MFESSVIELSKSALSRNLRYLHKEFGEEVTISSVVKGNAYGHGIEEFVPLAEKCGVRHFSVFGADEAYRVHACRTEPTSEIMIMGFADADGLAWAIENGVSFFVSDRGRLELALELAGRLGRPARAHLELETGMNRTGLKRDEIDDVVAVVLEHSDRITVEAVCTHYAGAESIANYKRIQDQTFRFEKMCERIEARGLKIPMRHSAGSAAALSYPETRMDMVRIGIAQYGFWPSKETEMQFVLRRGDHTAKAYKDPLRRVLRWRSRVMSVSAVEAGEFVGYGTSYMTLRRQRFATVPVGYAHGFRRNLSNLGRVLIRGRRANVIGLVNMSMMMVDVTSIPAVAPGDEVVIIGGQKKARITVGSFSDLSNLVNYEMLVRLPSDIPRVVVT